MRRGRVWSAVGLLTVMLAVSAVLSVLVGARELSVVEVLETLSGRGTDETRTIMSNGRLPRTAVAVGVGAALGAAGALIQALTRNPLADPGILGVNAGAALFVTVTVGTFGLTSTSALLLPAFVGSLLATLAVLLLAGTGRGPSTPLRMTLAGVALAAVLSGVTAAIRLTDPDTFDRMRAWAAGSTAGRGLGDFAGVLPWILLGLIVAIILAPPLDAVSLGDDVASSLGVNLRLIRVSTVVAVALLAGAAVAIAGPIGFVGLMVPHALRLLVGHAQVRLVPLSILAGPVLMLSSDVLSRVVIPGREVPVGVITAFVGAPVLILLIRGKSVKAL